jgi:hypothetical protein
MAGVDQVSQDSINSVFVKNSQISISGYVSFQGLKLQAKLVRKIIDINRAKVRKACLGADGGVLRENNLYFIGRILVFPAFDLREWRVDTGFGMFLGIASHEIEINTNFRDRLLNLEIKHMLYHLQFDMKIVSRLSSLSPKFL